MLSRIKLLTHLEICNLFGINQVKYSKNKKEKSKTKGVLFAYVFVYILFGIYGISYAVALASMGLASQIPTYFILITSVAIFFANIFKASNVLFNLKSYERLASLPIKPIEIVISRFLNMYITSIISMLVFYIPAMVICAINISAGPLFYIAMVLEAILIPFLSITVAILIGTLLMLATSRMKHKNAVKTVFSFVIMIACFGLSIAGNLMNTTPDDESQFVNMISQVADNINKYFLPSGFYYRTAIENSIVDFIYLLLIDIVPFCLVSLFVSWRFIPLCQRLNVTAKNKSNKELGFKKNGVLKTLIGREFKRLFSSPVYVVNSLFGYIIMIIISATICIVGIDKINQLVPAGDLMGKILAVILCFCLSMTTTTVSSISIEGKNWWISKSLPIDKKDLFNSKIAITLITSIPSCLISSLLIAISIKSANILDYFILFILPVSLTIYMAVKGLAMNIKYPFFNWNNEAEVVKQSKAVSFFMLIGFGILIAVGLPTILIPSIFGDIYALIVSIVLVGLAYYNYKKILNYDLRKIG